MTRRQYVPRAFASAVMDHFAKNGRCALWAKPGMGKSVLTLNYLDVQYNLFGDSYPTLVVAPLRVARDGWGTESAKWEHLAGFDVVPVIGTPDQRKAALRIDAPVYTINYDQLVWLVDTLGERWPFRRVVADEAVRLKGFRTKQGTQRAQALAKVAHSKVKEWINLTGTPSPNGLKDLWGQTYFLDGGRRLGRTFSAFENRWFAYKRIQDAITKKPGILPVILPNAHEEIHERLADICLSLDPRDWFDLKEPIVNVVEVELPPKARAKYRELERELFTMIDGSEVEVFNAASLSNKCLAAGTEVLTDSGWIPIECVTRHHLVWDGISWVNCDGVVYKGVKQTVKCWGVRMTHDHLVLTSRGWIQAKDVANGEPSKKFKRSSFRLPYRSAQRGDATNKRASNSYLAPEVRMWKGSCSATEFANVKEPRENEIVRMPPRRDASAPCPRNDRAPSMGNMEPNAGALHEQYEQGLAQLRRARDNNLRTLGGFPELLGGHGSDVEGRADVRPAREQPRLQPGKLPLGNSEGAGEQHPRKRVAEHAEGDDDGGAGGRGVRDKAGYDIRADAKRVAGKSTTNAAKVYDILNCGPRHRFVVRGHNEPPFIVHNCLQLANGSAYLDPEKYGKGAWVEMHREKLDALGELMEETGDDPLLVVYEFKSDRERIKREWPDALDLAVDADLHKAKAGKGKLWIGHPASIGEGIDGLQEWCNTVVFFGQTWRLDLHDQVIERVGPMRQFQSGKDRAVFIHYIVCRGTIDEVVVARRDGKRSVQDALMDYMKGKQ